MFALILVIISFPFFTSGRYDLDFNKRFNHNLNFIKLQNFKVEASGNAQAEELYRLPNDVKPVMYDLKMVPNLFGNFTFSGEVGIQLIIENPTTTVVLHSYRLDLYSVEVFRNEKKLDSNYTMSAVNQTVTIETKQKMVPNNDVRLIIAFNGLLNDKMKGFYRSTYRYKVGNTTDDKWLAMTQFEPTFARRAFPCFDEPAYKARFIISLARYPNQTAMSNMPLNKTSGLDPSIGNRVWDTFQVTPPLPTSKVAFVISEFSCRTNADEMVRVCTRKNAVNQASYGLTQLTKLLKQLEAYTGFSLTLPKLDIVAIPDFNAGAMENYGLSTYSEQYVVLDAKISDERNKELVTRKFAHELSEQLFGDSVTLDWWDYDWLNEGFATYFEYFATAMIEPSWELDKLFVVETVQFALWAEVTTQRAMTSRVNKFSQIQGAFDVISYSKAGSVIRMFEHILSPNIFRAALHQYLKSNENSADESSRLSKAFQEQMDIEGKSFPNNVTVNAILKTYEQIGFPFLSVRRLQDTDDSFNITIKQVAYKSPSSQNSTQENWVVPLACTKQSHPDFNNTQPTMWLIDGNPIVLSNEVKKDEWCICNLQQSVPCRVSYDIENWNLLIEQLHTSHLEIHPLNRAQLIDDACTFAQDGSLPYNIPFDLLRYLAYETDPIPWYTGLEVIYDLIQRHVDSKASKQLRDYAKPIVEAFYSRIGWFERPKDSHLVKTIRSPLLFVACDLKIKGCVAKAKSEFSSRNDLSEIPAYMKETVLCVAIKTSSDVSVWNKLWDLFRNSDYDYEKMTVLSAIGCTTDQTLLKQYLNKVIDKNDHDIPKQNEEIVFRSITRFVSGVTATIDSVHDMLPRIENCTKTHHMVMRLLHNIMDKVQTREHIHRLDHVIEEAEKLNQQKLGDVKETLINIRENAIEVKAKVDDEAEKILEALRGPEL